VNCECKMGDDFIVKMYSVINGFQSGDDTDFNIVSNKEKLDTSDNQDQKDQINESK